MSSFTCNCCRINRITFSLNICRFKVACLTNRFKASSLSNGLRHFWHIDVPHSDGEGNLMFFGMLLQKVEYEQYSDSAINFLCSVVVNWKRNRTAFSGSTPSCFLPDRFISGEIVLLPSLNINSRMLVSSGDNLVYVSSLWIDLHFSCFLHCAFIFLVLVIFSLR